MFKSVAVVVVLMALTASGQAAASSPAENRLYIVADIRPPSPERDVGEPKSRDTRPTPQRPADPAKRPTPRPGPSDGSSKPDASSSSRISIAAAIAVIVGVIVSFLLMQSGSRRPA